MSENIRLKAISNLLWRFGERFGAQGVNFIVSVVLARLLEPEIYGSIALIMVITVILQVFIDSGLGNALIQKKEADDLDFSTVFYFNIGICFILYIGMYNAAPYIARFYGDELLSNVIRVLSITLIISGVKNVQQAYVSRMLQFKKFFFSTIIGTIVAAIVGIVMAILGAGIWALVIQQVLNSLIDTVLLWLNVKWRPKLIFSFNRLKILSSFGWKLLISSLINTIYIEIWQLVIGKAYTKPQLAFYNRGEQFPKFIVSNINSSIDSVLLPIMSNFQDDIKKVKKLTRRSIITSTYIMAPLMMGLFFIAPTLVNVLLTEKWVSSVPFLRIFCIVYMFQPIHTANLNAIKALGRTDVFLNLEIKKKVIGLLLMVISVKYGVFVMALSLLISSFISQIINASPNKKLLKYGYLEQIKDILPSIIISILMGIVLVPFNYISVNSIIILLAQVFFGGAFYIISSKLLKLEAYNYLMGLLLQLFNKERT